MEDCNKWVLVGKVQFLISAVFRCKKVHRLKPNLKYYKGSKVLLLFALSTLRYKTTRKMIPIHLSHYQFGTQIIILINHHVDHQTVAKLITNNHLHQSPY